MKFNIVLFQPEIPQNTGNIARSCAVTGAALHIIRPMGFTIDDKSLKRAGLDYWDKLDVYYYDSIDELFAKNPQSTFYYCTTKGIKVYSNVLFSEGDFLVFGRETSGLPLAIREAHPKRCIRIPMGENLRSLNLSNSVAIVLYEALRQNGFEGLS